MTNALIALMGKQFDPLAVDQQVEQTNALAKQNRLADLAFGEKQRAIEQGKTENALYKAAVSPDGSLDQNKLFSGYAESGLGSKLPDLQKKFLDANKVSTDLKKTQGEISAQDFALKQTKHKVAVQNLASLLADPELSYDKAVANIQAGIQDGHLDPKAAAGQLQALPQDPAALRLHLQKGLMSVLTADQQLQALAPKTEFKDAGGSVVGIQMNPNMPGYGQPIQGAQINKTQSPDNAATIANSASNAQLTDARAREFNATKVEENKIKREAKDDANNLTKSSQIASFDTMLGTLDRLGKHPGLSRSVGAIGAFPTMPGSDSANFQAELNTFQSQAFLPMVAQLKGMGALSDAEGKKLTAAVGALDPKMGEKAFRESVARITADMEAARKRMVGAGGAGSNPSAPQASRKTIGGKTYENDGKGWYEVK
jgi:hypothetical protein